VRSWAFFPTLVSFVLAGISGIVMFFRGAVKDF
jgi:hypothetical protein